MVEGSRGNAEEAGQERSGGNTGERDLPFQQEQALRLAQLFLTSRLNSGQPSPYAGSVWRGG